MTERYRWPQPPSGGPEQPSNDVEMTTPRTGEKRNRHGHDCHGDTLTTTGDPVEW
jgi:hypothetical protein